MEKLDDFAEYGRIWIDLINRMGGTHHGYFLPCLDPKAGNHGRFSFPGMGHEGEKNIGLAIFSFPNWDVYEQYRKDASSYPECEKASKIVEESKCFSSYERSFMTPILGKQECVD